MYSLISLFITLKISSIPFNLSYLPTKTNFNLSDFLLDNFLITQDDSTALGIVNIESLLAPLFNKMDSNSPPKEIWYFEDLIIVLHGMEFI